jgi:predicted P-loop ATPase
MYQASTNIPPTDKTDNTCNAISSGWQEIEHYFPMKHHTNEPALLAWNKVGKGVYKPEGSYGIALQADDLCLDCDPKNYPPGRDPLKEWLTLYPTGTRAVKTPSNGWHLRYKKDPTIKIRKAQKLYPGIEFRSENHCIVGPGCHRDQVMTDGRHVVGDYVLINDGAPALLPLSILTTLEQAASAVKTGADDWSLDSEDQFKQICQSEEPAAPKSDRTRGITAFKIAARARDLNLPLEVAYQHLANEWNPRNLPPLPEKELLTTVENAYAYAKNAPGSSSPEAVFKKPELTVLKQSNNVTASDSFQNEEVKKTLFQKILTPKLDKNNKVIGAANTQGNVIWILRHSKYWHGRIFYNQFADRVEIKNRPDWRRDQINKTEGMSTGDYEYIQGWLSATPEYMLEVGIERIAAAVRVAATPYHPVKDYLNGLKWDGLNRLDRILPDTTGCKDTPYTRDAGRCILISAVKRIFEPGCKQDYLLVLESEQGTKKSTWVETLGGDWYSTGELIPNDKDTYQALRGKWIVELPEIDNTFSKAEFAWLKKTITTSVDTYRPSYARTAESVPRESVFIATLNPSASGEYLRDFQNRRYWPVATGRFDIDRLIKMRDQYFAEACHRYREGEKPWITDPEIVKLAVAEQSSRRESDPWVDILAGWCLAHPDEFGTNEVLAALGFQAKEVGAHHRKRAYQVLKELGFEFNRGNSGDGMWQKMDAWKHLL